MKVLTLITLLASTGKATAHQMAREIVWTKRANNKFYKILEYLELKLGSQATKISFPELTRA